jgi:AcrR family transcriptional regulator
VSDDPLRNEAIPISMRLLWSFEREVAEHGLSQASLKTAAERVGASKSAYYYHFRGRGDDLLRELCLTIIAVHEAKINESRMAYIDAMEKARGVSLYTRTRGQGIALKPGLKPEDVPFEPIDCVKMLLVPSLQHILDLYPRCHFTRFMNTMHLQARDVLEELLAGAASKSWFSISMYPLALMDFTLRKKGYSEKKARYLWLLAGRQCPVMMSVFEYDVNSDMLKGDYIYDELKRVIAALCAFIEPVGDDIATELDTIQIPDCLK